MINHQTDLSANATVEPCSVKSDSLLRSACAWLPAISMFTSLTWGACLQVAYARDDQDEIPFKFTNFHFEVNASACDWGPQILFDTEGIVSGRVKDPRGHTVYVIGAKYGLKGIGGQTEGVLEAVEPVVEELVIADPPLMCDVDPEEPVVTLDDMRAWFPEGTYEFEGRSVDGEEFDGTAELTYVIPAGPYIIEPSDGENMVDPTIPLPISWDPVTASIIPGLGVDGGNTVNIAGYHLVIKEFDESTGPLVSPQVDIDLPADVTSVLVPAAYLEPSTMYEFEVLATEESGNQTITEGLVFCTTDSDGLNPLDPCELP